MSETIAGLLGLVGVLVGAQVAARAADRKWIRELKVIRYNDLVHHIADGHNAVLAWVDLVADPQAHSDYPSLMEAMTLGKRRISEAMDRMLAASAELAVYADLGVRLRALEVLNAMQVSLGQLLPLALEFDAARLAGRNEGASVGSQESTWANDQVLAVAATIAERRDEVNDVLHARRRELVRRIRVDLGVDLVPPWRRLAWWRADRRQTRQPEGEPGQPRQVSR